MKPNQDKLININFLISIENDIKELVKNANVWKTLDVDYFPPRVERLYTDHNGYRIFLHAIHKTDQECLYHKHRWPAAFKQLKGSYEMGITYSEKEISSTEVHKLPTLSKFLINEGSYYEMTQTDCLHYVKPISDISYSIMITYDLYPEATLRREIVDKKLYELSNERKLELLDLYRKLI